MEKERTLKEKGKKKLKEWKQFAEELQVQLSLGVAESKDEFEKQKKNLKALLDNFSNQLEHASEVSKESLLKIRSSLESLRVQAALSKAETEDQLREQQKRLTHGIHDLKHKISSAYGVAKEETESFLEDVGDRLEDFHTRFDLLRLQAHLGKAEAKEEWSERKKELSHKLHEIKVKLHDTEEDATERWKEFSSEISSSWDHFKKAFRGND